MNKLLLSMILLLSVAVTNAQEQTESTSESDAAAVDSEQSSTEAQAVDEKNADAEQQDGNEQAVNADGEFIPSEEISEDLPVSFPVDI